MDELALAARAGLPDPLRVLVERYPRLGWEAHRNFTMLTRFWLDRHLGFRRRQLVLVADTDAFLSRERDPRAYGSAVLRVTGMFLDELHGHRTIEDHHYFTAAEVPRPAPRGWIRSARHRPRRARRRDAPAC
jgi:hypothetical protein